MPKYRRRGLRSEHLGLREDAFAKICSDFGAPLVEGNGEDDNPHLLIK